jgi:drug/metabolite transporter (DMT)-like permease
MTGSMAAFTVNDTFMKALSDELPLFQALGLRGTGATCLLLLIALALRIDVFSVPKGDRWRLALRSMCEAGGAFTFLGAVFNMEFANASAIGQVAPLVVALAAALWLGERLSPVRIASIVVGLFGVVLMLQPGPEGFNWWSLSVIACVLFVTARDIITRQMSHDIPAFTIVLYGAVAVAVSAFAVAAFDDFRPISLKVAGQLTGSVLFLIIGYFTAILTMRVGEVSFVAPFRYTSMLFSLILGWVFFYEWPNALTLLGAAIVIGAGLLSLGEEFRRSRPA